MVNAGKGPQWSFITDTIHTQPGQALVDSSARYINSPYTAVTLNPPIPLISVGNAVLPRSSGNDNTVLTNSKNAHDANVACTTASVTVNDGVVFENAHPTVVKFRVM